MAVKFLIVLFYMITTILFIGCGSSPSEPRSTPVPTPTPPVENNISCKYDEYKRLKTGECSKLQHPNWGFQNFSVSQEYNLTDCTQNALNSLILEAESNGGGKVIMPACDINISGSITINDNIILEGAGIGETTLYNNLNNESIINLNGENTIIRNFTIDAKFNLNNRKHAINGFKTKGNVLVEHIEVKNTGYNENSGISFYTTDPLKNSRITIRYNKISYAYIGVDLRVEADTKALIYSNESSNNNQWGIDMHGNTNVEVAGNYLHSNKEGGAKSPSSSNIIYHHNDITNNEKVGIVYGNGNEYITNAENRNITIEYNDLSNNGGPAFAPWMGTSRYKLEYLILRDNNTTNSTDDTGNNIKLKEDDGKINQVDIYGDHGTIWGEYTLH